MDRADVSGVLVEFLTWPIIRYKREVLFGWVDLLVSFGGIASLFLGFSLLSGVEIIYYFTLRACCMVYKNRVRIDLQAAAFITLIVSPSLHEQQELHEIEERIRHEPPPAIDLQLKLRSHSSPSAANSSDSGSAVLLVQPADGEKDADLVHLARQRKSEKVSVSSAIFDREYTLTLFLSSSAGLSQLLKKPLSDTQSAAAAQPRSQQGQMAIRSWTIFTLNLRNDPPSTTAPQMTPGQTINRAKINNKTISYR